MFQLVFIDGFPLALSGSSFPRLAQVPSLPAAAGSIKIQPGLDYWEIREEEN